MTPSSAPARMEVNLLQPNPYAPPRSNLHFRTYRSFPRKNALPTFVFLNHHSRLPHFSLLRLRRKPSFKIVRGMNLDHSVMEDGELLELEGCDLLLETCITRNLSPAMTLERGMEMIKEELEKLKLNPPCSSSGIYRFQVAVPPSTKALNWFCCQPESLGVFPQFFLSKEAENPTCKSLSLNRTRGVFGVGAAIYFRQSSSSTSGGWSLFQRYLSPDSSLMMAYGFMDINIKADSSYTEHETGSFYFFIPQVELDEHDGISILAATLAWSDSSLCTFGEAVHSFELSLHQVSHHCWPTTGNFPNKCIRSTLRKFNALDDKTVQMVYMKAFSLDGKDVGASPMELVSPFS